VREQTESTNTDAIALADSGAPQWTVVAADYQRAGRGRLDRQWLAEPGRALTFSVILRPGPGIPVDALGWVPLIAGIAVCDAAHALGVPAGLKWPNDVVLDGLAADGTAGPRKLAGILSERVGSAVVVGVGLNVSQDQDRLPIPAATSLAIEGATGVDRADLLASIVASLRRWWSRFELSNGDAARAGILDRYRVECLTIGRRVRVLMPGREDSVGIARDVDSDGHLLLAVDPLAGLPADTPVAISAGDVIHVT
jgi:BirA family biotin operon repressor/biotin-[acetyl-CoA-carboxylase] ligase